MERELSSHKSPPFSPLTTLSAAKMHPSHLLLSLILLLPLSAASPPPVHDLRFSNNHLDHCSSGCELPKECFEVARPLPFDSITPSRIVPLFSHTFGHTIDLPPARTIYWAPWCKWTNVVLQFSASCNGTQSDRIAAVWLTGVELLRTSTPRSTTDSGVFWSFRKDITKYDYLLHQSNITLAVMLENAVTEIYTGSFTVNMTLLFYDVIGSAAPKETVDPTPLLFRNQKSSIRKLIESRVSPNLNKSLESNDSPADLILPISADGDEGFWYKIHSESDAIYHGIEIPLNTYRAVIEVYVSFHGNDEYWYLNPPDSYIVANCLPTKRGHGAFREVLAKIDDNVVGSVIPFPVIFPGGINPAFWCPVVSIGAFDLPSYEFEITPFLGLLLDGRKHLFGLQVFDAISYWLINANLHLWLDPKSEKVLAGPIKYSNPSTCVERESKYEELDGEFEIEGERKSEFSGWVSSSFGNITTQITCKLEYENTVKYKSGGTKKSVDMEVKVKNKVEVKPTKGHAILKMELERKYPLKLKTTALPGSGEDNYLLSTELEHSLEEEKKINDFKSNLETKQESSGWMFVHDEYFLSGSAKTSQNYKLKDNLGCYSRRISVENGGISKDTEKFLCASAPSDSLPQD